MKYFPLYNSKKILREGTRLYRRRGKELSAERRKDLEDHLEKLDEAVVKKDGKKAADLASTLKSKLKIYFPKTFYHSAKEFISALLFAIVFALFIREMWFELYEVPTGSMRPTIEELDRLVVSKTRFGIHFPLQKGLLLYKPEYLMRAEPIVFTVEDMDVSDSDTMYFWVIPGKKRFVKRNLGKPGDTVYFYGGLLYGVDKDGNPITELADIDYLKKIGIEKIDHVPNITFDGKVETRDPLAKGIYGTALFKQMDIPVARLKTKDSIDIKGEFFDGKEWQEENLSRYKEPHSKPVAYSDLWGIGNYAMARLLSWNEIEEFYPGEFKKDSKAALYLELHHTPNLSSPKPELRHGETGKVYPALSTQVTVIPLSKEHLERLQKAMITARFFVRNGRAFRYHEGTSRPQPPEYDPRFSGVPDGLYEIYYGKAYAVNRLGIQEELPQNHPLYDKSSENVKRLFNYGFNFNNLFTPVVADQPFLPQRFVYFRDGDLYSMGVPFLFKDDPTLIDFVKKEKERGERASYVPFIDHGAPLKEGKIDTEFIRSFGLKVAEDGVLALGDNYAMSADSRDFGFVPIQNLRGSPSFTFWPPSKRLGSLPGPTSHWVTAPNMIVWSIAFIFILVWLIYLARRHRKPYFKRIN